MFRKENFISLALYLCGGVAIGVCLALIVYMVYVLQLRTEYRATCLEINDAILAAGEEASIERDGAVWPLDQTTLDYYNMRLLDEGTVVYNRRAAALNARSIIIHLGDDRLSFTGLEDGSAINIRWETSGKTRYYTVRSSVSFMQLTAYLSNYIRKTA